ncbi:hypothetical protein ACVILI_005334 [Mesorhizobium sp. USDA 4775]
MALRRRSCAITPTPSRPQRPPVSATSPSPASSISVNPRPSTTHRSTVTPSAGWPPVACPRPSCAAASTAISFSTPGLRPPRGNWRCLPDRAWSRRFRATTWRRQSPLWRQRPTHPAPSTQSPEIGRRASTRSLPSMPRRQHGPALSSLRPQRLSGLGVGAPRHPLATGFRHTMRLDRRGPLHLDLQRFHHAYGQAAGKLSGFPGSHGPR